MNILSCKHLVLFFHISTYPLNLGNMLTLYSSRMTLVTFIATLWQFPYFHIVIINLKVRKVYIFLYLLVLSAFVLYIFLVQLNLLFLFQQEFKSRKWNEKNFWIKSCSSWNEVISYKIIVYGQGELITEYTVKLYWFLNKLENCTDSWINLKRINLKTVLILE